MSDPDGRREALERIVALGRGPKGDQGERGARGLSQLQGRAVVVLFAMAVGLACWAVFWVGHAVGANNHKFCAVVTTLTVPVPRPADPVANPSREHAYVAYMRVAQLGRSLGCD